MNVVLHSHRVIGPVVLGLLLAGARLSAQETQGFSGSMSAEEKKESKEREEKLTQSTAGILQANTTLQTIHTEGMTIYNQIADLDRQGNPRPQERAQLAERLRQLRYDWTLRSAQQRTGIITLRESIAQDNVRMVIWRAKYGNTPELQRLRNAVTSAQQGVDAYNRLYNQGPPTIAPDAPPPAPVPQPPQVPQPVQVVKVVSASGYQNRRLDETFTVTANVQSFCDQGVSVDVTLRFGNGVAGISSNGGYESSSTRRIWVGARQTVVVTWSAKRLSISEGSISITPNIVNPNTGRSLEGNAPAQSWESPIVFSVK